MRPPITTGNAVTLSTIHGEKGLEWPVVALIDINGAVRDRAPALRLATDLGVAYSQEGEDAGLYTLIKAMNRKREAEEEARLVYVGMSRARDRLICSSSHQSAPAVQALRQAGLLPHWEPEQTLDGIEEGIT